MNGGTPEQQVTFDVFDNAYGTIGMQGSGNNNVPAAYLNYILFDQNMVYKQSGFKQISGAANMSSEYVSFDNDIVIPEAGFIYCFVSFENTTGRVFWDDFKVTHVEHPVIQTDDYYPFGLTYNSWQRSSAKENKYNTFQDQERIDALDLGWYSFKWRNHMPEIGRFFNVDPLAEDYYYNSPYAFSENKVVAHVELEGLEAEPINASLYYAHKMRGAKGLEDQKKINKMTGTGTVVGVSIMTGLAIAYKTGTFGVLLDAIGLGSLAEDDNTSERKVPNPDGKKGGQEHQKKNEEVVKEIEERGNQAESEDKINTPNGEKNYRYADQAEVDPNTGEVIEYHQVGKQNKNGTPVSRERKAAKDTEDATGKPVKFHPYNKKEKKDN